MINSFQSQVYIIVFNINLNILIKYELVNFFSY